jgi:hypothetical protein
LRVKGKVALAKGGPNRGFQQKMADHALRHGT